jgi:hypothetical protein
MDGKIDELLAVLIKLETYHGEVNARIDRMEYTVRNIEQILSKFVSRPNEFSDDQEEYDDELPSVPDGPVPYDGGQDPRDILERTANMDICTKEELAKRNEEFTKWYEEKELEYEGLETDEANRKWETDLLQYMQDHRIQRIEDHPVIPKDNVVYSDSFITHRHTWYA